MKAQLNKRIAALEKQQQDHAETRQSMEKDAAFGRVQAVLKAALFTPPGETGARQDADNRNWKLFDQQLTALHERMAGGMLTDDDRHLLDSLPKQDLVLIGLTPEKLVLLNYRLFIEYYWDKELFGSLPTAPS